MPFTSHMRRSLTQSPLKSFRLYPISGFLLVTYWTFGLSLGVGMQIVINRRHNQFRGNLVSDLRYDYFHEVKSLWKMVDEDPTAKNIVCLYEFNKRMYHSPFIVHHWLHQWYVVFLYFLSYISKRSAELGLGEVSWSPIISNDEIMMIEPFMLKKYYVLSLIT